MGIVCQWPVLPSVFVCLRLFRGQFWKLNTISRKGFYALAKWVLTRRWKLNKLWLNKHAEPTMDSCDEWFSWQGLSGFFLTCRNAASGNGERAKYSLHSAMKNKHQEMAFKQSSAISHCLILSKYWHCLRRHLLAEPVYFISCNHLMEMHLIYKFWCWSLFGVFSILGLQKNCQHRIKTELAKQSEEALCACVIHLGWMGRMFEVAWGHLAAQWELGTRQWTATFAPSVVFQKKSRGNILTSYCFLIRVSSFLYRALSDYLFVDRFIICQCGSWLAD